MKLKSKRELGQTGIQVPQVIYGTSYLGNLYRELPYQRKLELMEGWFLCTEKPVVIDTAGKYGAGMALEVIGKGLAGLEIDPADVVISNKLGWYRIPLKGAEPAFEPGAWAGLDHDCIQTFGYGGIMECFEQGEQLLGGRYHAELVSVHDPDEYLLLASDPSDRDRRMLDILDSYRALFDLKNEGKVKAVGVGSKDWSVIKELYAHVPFDWVMFANSFTVLSHSREIVNFMDRLDGDGVGIINSALFHGGFLTGGDKFDYREVDPSSEKGKYLLAWRKRFHSLCAEYGITPGDAAMQFGLSHPAIVSVALNTSKPEKMKQNVETLMGRVPSSFWQAMKQEGLMDPDYKYL
jgi:D-threo-aldose 1-dehydrogenase